MNVKVSAILSLPHEEVELKEFVRKFGNRIEGNYKCLLNSIEEVGAEATHFAR
jgi:hypothetical protein